MKNLYKLYKAKIIYKIKLKSGLLNRKIEIFEIGHNINRIFVAESPHSAQAQVLKLKEYHSDDEKLPWELRYEEEWYALKDRDYEIIDINARVEDVSTISIETLIKYMDHNNFVDYIREML